MIAIVDYGVGNLFSLESSFRFIGEDATVTSDPDVIRRADRVVLPGVGAFEDAVDAVNKCIKVKATVVPNPENTAKYAEIFKTYKAVHDALAPIYRDRSK